MTINIEAVIDAASERLGEVLASGGVDAGHGLEHAKSVLSHAQHAVEADLQEKKDGPEGELKNPENQLAVLLAALLHDADDRKFFPAHKDYENARAIMREVLGKQEGFGEADVERVVALVIKLIDLVSCSKNKDAVPEGTPNWHLIPRYSDRLEAVGLIGIQRCYEYNTHVGAPMSSDATPRATNEEQLQAIATPERYAQYNGGSASMIDHYYDKLLHVSPVSAPNAYIRKCANERRQVMADYCLEFGKTGVVPNPLTFGQKVE